MDDRIETGAGHPCVPPLLLAALAIAVAAVPGAATTLQFEPGQALTALTGHLAHWNLSHLLWDTIALCALGALCCHFSRSRFWIAMATSAIAIPISIVIWLPELTSYRGLSGIDSALLGLALVEFGRHARRRRKPALLLMTGATGICFCLKLLFEFLSGDPCSSPPRRRIS
jgi:membrane associated rhomboid family serine protease